MVGVSGVPPRCRLHQARGARRRVSRSSSGPAWRRIAYLRAARATAGRRGAAWVSASARTCSTTSPCRSARPAIARSRARSSSRTARVYMLKRCPVHGDERVLMADDVDYYRRCREVFIKPPEMPLRFNTPVRWGCPYDCGLCADHQQHSCLSLIEVTDHCNLRCPICYAEQRAVAAAVPHPRSHRADARRGRAQRGRARRRADLRRRADDPPGVLRHPRPRQGRARSGT